LKSIQIVNAWKWAKAAGVETLVSIEAISYDHWADANAIWQFVCGEHRWSLDENSTLVHCRLSLRVESLKSNSTQNSGNCILARARIDLVEQISWNHGYGIGQWRDLLNQTVARWMATLSPDETLGPDSM